MRPARIVKISDSDHWSDYAEFRTPDWLQQEVKRSQINIWPVWAIAINIAGWLVLGGCFWLLAKAY